MSKVKQAMLKILTWTPSRLDKWRQCPAKVKYEDLLKLCPACFKGKVSGGFDGEPVKCDTCDKPQPERGPLDRGNMLDDALTKGLDPKVKLAKVEYMGGRAEEEQPLAAALRHPKIHALYKTLRKAKGVKRQESIVIDASWKRVSQFTKGAWARLKLDVLWIVGKKAKVIDWKSGNIDKMEIREKPSYAEAMRAYQIAVLSVYPEVTEVEATMAFIDAPPKLDNPFKSLPVLKRRDLKERQDAWVRTIEPMMNDTIFATRPGYYCGWCPFSKKANGGPCPH